MMTRPSITAPVVALLLLACAATYAQSGYITSIAGNGITQYIGDGWPATNYSLATPLGICMDKQGTIFTTDFSNHRLRKITASDSLYTYAGTGTSGYTGDNGPALAANMRFPYGIVNDTADNMYFTDFYSNVIRRIDRATGVITTICGTGTAGFSGDGGPATAAMLESPKGICIDKVGDLYFADERNNRIRKIDMHTNIITTVAGTTSNGYAGDGGAATAAKLSYPVGVCVDSIGNIYIADYENHAIRKVDGTTHIISTIAGNGVIGYNGDGAPASAAQLVQPNYVHMSKRGYLYITDEGANVLRMISPDETINTIAGTGVFSYTGDGGPAHIATFNKPSAIYTDTYENIYVADASNSAIRKIQNIPLGVTSINHSAPLSIYPNPSTGIYYISGVQQGEVVYVYNTVGAMVYEAPSNNQIDITNQPAGIYYVRIVSGDVVRVGNVLKR